MEISLAIFQSKLKAPKNQRNNFGNYNYRSKEDILEALKPILNDVGFWVTISDELILLGNRFYIKSTAIITNGTIIYQACGYAREEETKKGMDGSQITGAASSYAGKYALNNLLGIDDTKDSDATNKHEIDDKKSSLLDAVHELDAASSIDQLKSIWSKFKQFQNEITFIEKKEQIKSKLSINGNN